MAGWGEMECDGMGVWGNLAWLYLSLSYFVVMGVLWWDVGSCWTRESGMLSALVWTVVPFQTIAYATVRFFFAFSRYVLNVHFH